MKTATRLLPSALVAAAAACLGGPVLTAPVASAATVRSVTVLAAPKSATLGNRVAITVKVASPAQARTVQLQTLTKDIYGNLSWSKVGAQHVNGVAKHTFKPVLNQANRQRFRAVAAYKSGRPVASKAVGVTVWSWTPLSKIPAYYATNGINGYEYSNFAMAGNQYLGWFTYGSYGMWEERYTTGRHCKALRGDLGVTDNSADGSTAQFTVANIDTGATLYQSPSLSPGAVTKVTLALPMPYRISIQARNTSTNGQVAYPAIGVPELLCTGLTS
jgi:hypothetical protein